MSLSALYLLTCFLFFRSPLPPFFFSKKKNAVEACSLPPCCTQAVADLSIFAAVVRHFVAAEVAAAAFAAPVVDATAAAAAAVAVPAVVFDVASAGFPADVASTVAASDFYIDVASAVAAAFHLASAVCFCFCHCRTSCWGGEVANFCFYLITFCYLLGSTGTWSDLSVSTVSSDIAN